MDNRKTVERMQDIGVTLRIPPGDFRKVRIDDSLQMRLSHDLAEFMSACKGQPAKFYVLVKFYLSERRGLHKMMKSNSKGKLAIIEACMNATIVSLMTIAVTNLMDSGKFKPDKKLHKCVKELRDALKSKERMLDFDRYCNDLYGVAMVHVNVSDSDDEESFGLDTHINAES